jgi:putative Holliday junction resolvase
MSATATALKTLKVRDGQPTPEAIQRLIKEWEPDTLVVGVPYNADGSDSSMSVRAKKFGQLLGEQTGLMIDFVNEHRTSLEAAEILREQRSSGQKKRRVRREEIDSLAARLIGERWLRNE